MSDNPTITARSLSAAQRAALLNVKEPTAFATRWFSRMHGSTNRALFARGLADYDAAPSRITPLGLAVRQALQDAAK